MFSPEITRGSTEMWEEEGEAVNAVMEGSRA